MKQFNILPEIKEKMLRAREGEITIILGEDTGTNLEVSLRHAESLRRSKRFDHVLYINLPFTKRRFTETAQQNGTHVNEMMVKHFPTGNLYRPMNNMQDMFEKSPNTAIIINAWEYASSSYGCRESLIFKLMELTRGLGVTVIVYAMNKPETVTAGRINRTGLGKLAGITSEVIVLEEVDGSADSQSADVVVGSQARKPELPMPELQIPMDTIITIAPQEKSIVGDLVDKEINDLAHPNGHLNRREKRRMERMATIGRV